MADSCEDKKQDNRPYLTFSFAGMVIKFGGKEILSIMIAALIGGPVIAGLYLHDEKTDRRLASIEFAIKDSSDASDATNYILTLSQQEREKLNLAMPKRIREMRRGQERE